MVAEYTPPLPLSPNDTVRLLIGQPFEFSGYRSFVVTDRIEAQETAVAYIDEINQQLAWLRPKKMFDEPTRFEVISE